MLSRMKLSWGLAFAGLLLIATVPAVGQDAPVQQEAPVQPSAATQPDEGEITLQVNAAMEGGVGLYKSGRYADAAASFVIATRLSPQNQLAHFYLGSAYASQVVANALTPDNTEMASAALAELDIVLKSHPHYLPAVEQEATVYRDLQMYDQALPLEREAAAMDPNDVDVAYALGYLDWVESAKNAAATLKEDGILQDDGLGNTTLSHRACDTLRTQNNALVNEGIASLKRVLEHKPDNADAMQYLQLMYRRRADLECGERSGLGADLKLADQWKQKAVELRKQAAAPTQK
jgi:tetratricopeptide (TPR) repeat protein